jgi:hypothetical protein
MIHLDIIQIAAYFIVAALTVIPSLAILRRVEKPRAWAFLGLLPLGIFIVFWIVAYSRWGIVDARMGAN